jgi:hypothetical protein
VDKIAKRGENFASMSKVIIFNYLVNRIMQQSGEEVFFSVLEMGKTPSSQTIMKIIAIFRMCNPIKI